ncbi:hypothetical protein GPK34_00805 [Secundilactobacillus kimchicus]|uniref:hypothetical protein n=1 Tax=Secundilactobacillus kimchicus TaxID=528209 RepID=UPI001C01C7F0|nr:hypothetical protein [Secundilactobacillus kimchicus]MBT9670578.1 hypothetical protein [Secundilactobacillus kimchicus]
MTTYENKNTVTFIKDFQCFKDMKLPLLDRAIMNELINAINNVSNKYRHYDKLSKRFYVYFPYSALGELIGVSAKTISRCFARLTQQELVITEKDPLNNWLKIFVPGHEFFIPSKDKKSDEVPTKCPTNKILSRDSSDTGNTDNTQASAKPKLTNQEIAMQNLAERIISKANLPRVSVEVMVSLAVDSDRLNLYAGSIFIAKARANNEFVDAVEPTVDFEDTLVQKTFIHAVKRIIFAAERKCGQNAKYLKNYMANAFYNYFLEIHDAKTLMESPEAAGYLFNERRQNYLMNNYVSLVA